MANVFGRLVGPVIILALLAAAIVSLASPAEFTLPSFGDATFNEEPMSEDELLLHWGANSALYQLDVHVTSNHAATHLSSSAAMRCLNQNGNVAAFSEYGTWTLHLLCWDGETLYDIIISRINKYTSKWENPNSHLKTAYAPEGIRGANMLEKVNFYLSHLKETVGGKVVNLTFRANEIMFIPK